MNQRVEILLLDSEQDYHHQYLTSFVGKSFFLFEIPVIFTEEDFAHIFSEAKSEAGRVFSKRRAKKMLFMEALITAAVERELVYEPDSGNFALFCADLDCVV
jgi:hypothetical protein